MEAGEGWYAGVGWTEDADAELDADALFEETGAELGEWCWNSLTRDLKASMLANMAATSGSIDDESETRELVG